ncbi:hypothetical protein M8C21_027993, partial [Ambrosia artemisiifolia]
PTTLAHSSSIQTPQPPPPPPPPSPPSQTTTNSITSTFKTAHQDLNSKVFHPKHGTSRKRLDSDLLNIRSRRLAHTYISTNPCNNILSFINNIFTTLQLDLYLLRSALISTSFARFAAGFTGSVMALSAVCLFYAAGNMFYSSVALPWDMAQRMLAAVQDWSSVKTVLDVGCSRGILLNAVAMELKKEGSSGRVVGLDRGNTTLSTLRTAALEGVQEYVTFREGDARRLPFADNYFDVVVSAGFVHKVGKEFGAKTAAAAAERMRVVGEVVRVLKEGGVGVVWDLVHVPEYVLRLQELKMEDIKVSERVTAFMVNSHIVSFRKPSHQHVIGPSEVRLDWRFNNIF